MRPSFHELRRPQIWRGWNGRVQVSKFRLWTCPFIETFSRSLRPLIIALIPGQQRDLDKLKAMRLRLSNEVADVINEFGPKLYDDFDQVCCHFLCGSAIPFLTLDSSAFWYRRALPRPLTRGFGDGRAA